MHKLRTLCCGHLSIDLNHMPQITLEAYLHFSNVSELTLKDMDMY